MRRLERIALRWLAAATLGALVWALTWAIAAPACAHDIPADVRINAFFKPDGNKLELLVRLPLASLIDTDFPIRGNGSLDIARADEPIRGGIKVWLTDNMDVYENGVQLPKPRVVAALVSLPSDKSFTSFEEARAHVFGPKLSNDLDLYWSQVLLDVLLEYPIQSDHSEFAVDLRVDRLGGAVNTALRVMPPGGAIRAFDFHGASGIVYLDPRWYQAVLRFVVEGFWHILDGTDHLLFLACLVIPVRRLRPLIIIVTSFTVAHSINGGACQRRNASIATVSSEEAHDENRFARDQAIQPRASSGGGSTGSERSRMKATDAPARLISAPSARIAR